MAHRVTQHFGGFRGEADMDVQAKPAGSVENDPKRSFGDALVNHLVGAQEKRLLDRQLHCFRHCDGSVLLKTIKDRGRRELRGTETRGHSRFPSSTPVG